MVAEVVGGGIKDEDLEYMYMRGAMRMKCEWWVKESPRLTI